MQNNINEIKEGKPGNHIIMIFHELSQNTTNILA